MLKYLITVYTEAGSLSCDVVNENQARILMALLVASEAVKRLTLHHRAAEGLVLLKDEKL